MVVKMTRETISYGSRGDKKVFNIGDELAHRTDENVNGLQGGVSISWLVKAFRMGRGKLEGKLIGCPIIGYGKHRVALYDLPTAAAYLIEPKHDLIRLLDKLEPKDLPESLREPYWNAKLKEQRYLEKAGELWPTDLVIDKISEVLAKIKAMLTIVPDTLERDAGLTADQRLIAKTTIDELQTEIYEFIVGLGKVSFTPSQYAQHVGDAGDGDDEESEDDKYGDLI